MRMQSLSEYNMFPVAGLPPAATMAVYTGTVDDTTTTVKRTGSKVYKRSSPRKYTLVRI
jgi:hypothetical protein